jgi:hypothetical protein
LSAPFVVLFTPIHANAARAYRRRTHGVILTCAALTMRQNGLFFEFSLCLSRACLGKMIILI